METPLTEALKSIEEAYSIKIDYGFKEIYLEKEKKVIIEAFHSGAITERGLAYVNIDEHDSKIYYKETFN